MLQPTLGSIPELLWFLTQVTILPACWAVGVESPISYFPQQRFGQKTVLMRWFHSQTPLDPTFSGMPVTLEWGETDLQGAGGVVHVVISSFQEGSAEGSLVLSIRNCQVPAL